MPEYGQRRGGGGGGFGGGRGRNMGDPNDPESEQYRKLFIGGLSYDTSEESLKSHFEQWGDIVDCVVMKDPNTKRSRGFGFITYKESAMLDAAQAARPHKLDGREVESKRAMPRDPSGQSESQQSVKKMFVGGLNSDTTEDQVREVFGEFGNIDKVDLIKDKNTGKIKGFCFVTFDDHDPVDKCVLKKKHNLNGKVVEVKKALPKGEGGDSGGRGGGRGGGGGSYSGGGSTGYGGASSGYGGAASGGGYGGGGYGSQGGYGAGGYGAQSGGGWNQGGGSGGYGDQQYQGGYANQGAGGGWAGASTNFGSNYGNDYSGGPVRGGGYTQRGSQPYGGGGAGGGGAGGYGGGYRN